MLQLNQTAVDNVQYSYVQVTALRKYFIFVVEQEINTHIPVKIFIQFSL